MLAHFSHHVLTALLVPLLPFIRNEFALDYTQAGWVISAFTLSNGIGQLPAGWLADRIGPRIMITIGISGVALAGLLFGLSQTYIMMILFLVLMGLAGGGYHPSATPLISASVEPNNRGRALGIHVIGGSASHFVAPLIGVGIASVWGWRGSYIGLAIPTIVFGIILYMLLGRRAGTGRGRQQTADIRQEIPSAGVRWRRLVPFIILSTFCGATVFSIIGFIPLFMVDHFGVDEKTVAIFLAIIYSAGLWAAPLGGYLSDRLGQIPVILAICFIAGPLIYLMNLVPYGVGFGALLLIIGMVTTMRMPVSEAYIIGQTPERRRSTILGIYFFAGMEGGGVLTPVIGNLIDRFGFYPSFATAGAALFIVTIICSMFLLGKRD